MAAIQLAEITPRLLKWGRERAKLSIREAADKASITSQKLASWEEGRAKPSLRQAQKLAHVLYVPFGYLFLSSPPVEEPALADLRTVANSQRDSFSPNFIELLNDVMRKQQWYKEYLLEESADRLPFVGKFQFDHNQNQVAADIADTFGINNNFRDQVNSWTEFLFALMERVEDSRILVLRSGVVKNSTRRQLSVDEFRGFVITDEIIPLIFLNGKDAKAAQIFTLVHELAHIWIGQSGISNADLARREMHETLAVERFCNQVAAEVLVPSASFYSDWNRNANIPENLTRLTKRYRVSSLVILRRAVDLHFLPWRVFIGYYNDEWRRHGEREISRQSAGGNFYASLRVRNGKRLTSAVVSSALEGRTLYREAAGLLNVKVDSLKTLAVDMEIK